MTPFITLAQSMRDPELFGDVFGAPSFWPWHAVAKLLSGEPLDGRETDLFRECTGRSRVPTDPVPRLFILAGRRAGKDRFVSAVAVHRAALVANWRDSLSAGEQGVVTMLGRDKKQARILRRYCAGLLAKPLLAAEIIRDTDEMIEFRNGAALEIVSNDAQLIRGRSALAIIGTECCHWQTDDTKASSDEEVVAAAEPAMAMIPGGGLLVMQSSVHRRHGFMYRMFRQLHGNDDAEAICWLASSRTMNPALPEKVVLEAIERDAPRAQSEFNSIWRDDIAGFLDRPIIDAAVDRGVTVRPPRAGVLYRSASDPSGGARDSFTLAICHDEEDAAVLDCIVEIKAPFNPTSATATMAATLKEYGLSRTVGDRYSASWVVDAFSKVGIEYAHSERDRSAAYLDVLPLFMSGRVRLLDSPRLVSQFASLERRTSPIGKDRVDHGPNGHDDVCNSVALALSTKGDDFNIAEWTAAWGAGGEMDRFVQRMRRQW